MLGLNNCTKEMHFNFTSVTIKKKERKNKSEKKGKTKILRIITTFFSSEKRVGDCPKNLVLENVVPEKTKMRYS
jgi:hypothetical protein